MTALSVEHLYKIFGRRARDAVDRLRAGAAHDEVRRLGVTPAVVDATFEVADGEIFVVMGLSGSGKSTLIRMLNGLLEPTAGTVRVGDTQLTGLGPRELREVRRNRMSMVFQHFALFPHRTVLENAAYALEIRGVDRAEREDRAREALTLVGLERWGDHLPKQLSGGMKQRVGLARALAADTGLLLMDEAFSALDPLIRREMQDQLLDLQSRLGKTIVFITHDLNEAMRLGDRIAMMRDGRIVQIGTTEEILNDPASEYVAQFVQDVDRARVLTASSVMDRPLTVVASGAGPRAALRVMREHQSGAALVTSRDRRLQGAVLADDAVRALRAGAQSLSEVRQVAVASVSERTPLADVCAPAAESSIPVAVLDDEQRVVGVIPRVTLLAALGGIDPPDGNDDEVVPAVPLAADASVVVDSRG